MGLSFSRAMTTTRHVPSCCRGRAEQLLRWRDCTRRVSNRFAEPAPSRATTAPVGIRVVQQTLNTRQDSRDVIRRTPTVLQNVETQLAIGVHVWVKHLAEEFDRRRFVWIRLVERQHEAECTVFEWRLGFGVTHRRGSLLRQLRLEQDGDALRHHIPGPKMTAFQIIMLSAHGAPEMPPGGSELSRLKSRISRRRLAVDMGTACSAVYSKRETRRVRRERRRDTNREKALARSRMRRREGVHNACLRSFEASASSHSGEQQHLETYFTDADSRRRA